jgi:hypothetical protein
MSKKATEVDFDLYEVLDRAHVVQCHFDESISEHVAIENDPELRELVDKTQEAMMNLYQCAAEKWYRLNPELYMSDGRFIREKP